MSRKEVVSHVLTQTPVAFDGSTQSAAFSANTWIVRVHPTEDCHIAFGDNPTATTSSMFLPADVT